MVTIDRLHALRDRVRDLKGYLNIEAKLLEIAEEEKQTQDPDFWNDPKKAEQVLRTLRSKKTWTDSYRTCAAAVEDAQVMFDFWKGGDAAAEEAADAYSAAEKAVEELEFKNLIGLAGYSGLDIRATVGVLPRFSSSFHQKRQMAASDRTRLLRLLRKHQRAYGGPIAIAERLIIYSILEINSSQSIELKNVVLTAFPLPSAEFIAGPKSKTGLGPEAAKLSSQIESLRILIESR